MHAADIGLILVLADIQGLKYEKVNRQYRDNPSSDRLDLCATNCKRQRQSAKIACLSFTSPASPLLSPPPRRQGQLVHSLAQLERNQHRPRVPGGHLRLPLLRELPPEERRPARPVSPGGNHAGLGDDGGPQPATRRRAAAAAAGRHLLVR